MNNWSLTKGTQFKISEKGIITSQINLKNNGIVSFGIKKYNYHEVNQ